MAAINMASILAKAEKYMNTDKMQRQCQEKANQALLGKTTLKTVSCNGRSYSFEDAANKFLDVLFQVVASNDLTYAAREALGGDDFRRWKYTEPSKIGNVWHTYVYHAGDEYRPSLDERRYGGVNIVNLLDTGAKGGRPMKKVHGKWHGEDYWSKTVIPGIHFMEEAKYSFLGNYGSDYNVWDITIHRDE